MKFLLLLTAVFISLVAAQDGETEPDRGALPSGAAEGVEPQTVLTPRPTIYGYISSSGKHEILKAVVDALPNISVTLDEPGARFTLFAPTDSAIRDFARRLTERPDEGSIAALIQQIVDGIASIKRGRGFTDIRGILFYHILNRHYDFATLEDFGTITTAQGKNITFVNGLVRDLDPSRPDANAERKNIFTQNGWVNDIDSILLPFDLENAIRVSRPSPSSTPQSSDGVTPTDDPKTTDDPDASPSGPIIVPGQDETIEPSPSEEVGTSPEPDDGICFPSTARVHTPDGPITMEQLEAGQEVVHHESGKSSKVFLFTHRTKAYKGWFYRITTATGHAVTMTGNHYLYASNRLTAADSVLVGDVLRTVSGVSPVVNIEVTKGTGLYAPHSVHGDLVVDGIVVSGYSRAITPRVAHAVLAPVRWLVQLTGVTEPFGGLLYDGGRGIEKYLPKGKSRY